MRPLSRRRAICTLVLCTTSSIIFAAGTLAPRPSVAAQSHAQASAQVQSSAPFATPPGPVNQARADTNAPLPKIVERLRPDSDANQLRAAISGIVTDQSRGTLPGVQMMLLSADPGAPLV